MDFEQNIGELLRKAFPCSVLSNLPLFRPDVPAHALWGYEIDHLIHIKSGAVDRLVIIECKAQPILNQMGAIPTDRDAWLVRYPDRRRTGRMVAKDVKKQLENHAMALLHFFSPRPENSPLLIDACVVTNQGQSLSQTDVSHRYIRYHLFSEDMLFKELKSKSPLRVQQSPLLSELRMGVAVGDVGHPEMENAIRYVRQSRKALDSVLYRIFKPTENRWAINGSAGMGKSVLLAYLLFVLATDSEVSVEDEDNELFTRQLVPFGQAAEKLGLPAHRKRNICVLGIKPKQVEVLREFWQRFQSEFEKLADAGSLRVNSPTFGLWEGEIPENCNVLIIDEAHDLDEESQRTIAAWTRDDEEGELKRYLAIACDRHQKLRLVGARAPLIQGMNFSRRTRKLDRNYRNPLPVYAAGLALMFRWYAAKGAKVIPSRSALEDEFGLLVDQYENHPGEEIVLRNRNDTHPANNWQFTVSNFPACADAHEQLSRSNLGKRDVLWVRFGQEDSLFDYENLSEFTYHNCHTPESLNIVDKYIKGQEFPVVVIEGMPDALLDWEQEPKHDGPELSDAERDMWQARRQLYLCSSRSTTFLYFILDGSVGRNRSVAEELDGIMSDLAVPVDPEAPYGRTWEMRFKCPRNSREDDVFDDFDDTAAEAEAPETEAEALSNELEVSEPVTVRALAEAMGLQPYVLVKKALEMDHFVALNTELKTELAAELALEFGRVLTLRPEPSGQHEASEPRSQSSEPAPPKLEPEKDSAPVTKEIEIDRGASLRDLARAMGIQGSETGVNSANLLEPLPEEVIVQIADQHGFSVKFRGEREEEQTGHQIDEESIREYVESFAFRALRKKVDRYKGLLSKLYLTNSAMGTHLERLRRRQRVYFSKSRVEIEQNAASPNPHKIPETPYYALTTMDTKTKLSVLNDLMKDAGYSFGIRRFVSARF